MNKKRLIITSLLSIFLVTILLIQSTYSIFTTTEIDENSNIYTTGDLNITYKVSTTSIQFTDITPMTEEADSVIPYRITVTNTGNVPYMFDVILSDTTSSAENTIDYQYIMTKVGYLDTKSLSDCTNNIIKEDVILPAGESVDIDIRIWLDSTLSNSEIGKSFYAKLTIDGLAVYNADTENVDNSLLSLRYVDTSSLSTTFRSDTYITSIKSVSFVDYIDTSNASTVDISSTETASLMDMSFNIIPIENTREIISWDMSASGDGSIVAWLEDNEEEGYYDLYIGSTEKIYINSLHSFFSGMTALENVSFGNLDTSLTIKMSFMFFNCTNLTILDLSSFNTSNVTTMERMFFGLSSLTTLDLSNFDTSNVTTMNGMFQNSSSLTELDLGSFDTSNATNMDSMFSDCSSLTTTLTIRNSTTTYVHMFYLAATKEDSQITVNYTSDTSDLVDNMIATGTGNVVKGTLS